MSKGFTTLLCCRHLIILQKPIKGNSNKFTEDEKKNTE